MEQLCRKSPSDKPIRIVQFGEGNFLRAFIDWMVDGLNKKGLLNSQVQIIKPQPGKSSSSDAINEQGGLFTLITRGVTDGKIQQEHTVIESIKGCLNAYSDWEEVLKTFALPELRFIFSNTTEAGIEYRELPQYNGTCPETFPAKMTALCYHRFTQGLPGLLILPCELIEANGATLKKHMLHYAADWKLPEAFTTYINEQCVFYNTLVDRIVAGYPRNEINEIEASLGYHDKIVDCCEPFHFFAIEGPKQLLDELPLDKCGFNIVVAGDITPYRTRKVRFLNGAHTSSVLAASLGGLTFVDEMMNDADFSRLVHHVIYDEVFPTVQLPDEEKKFFADSIVERFLNPFANHRLLSISLNSVSKWKVRCLPSLLDYMTLKNALPPMLTFSFAALLRFYRQATPGAGNCEGRDYPIADNPDVLAEFVTASKLPNADYVKTIAANSNFWGQDLTAIPVFTTAVTNYLDNIDARGIRKALQDALN